VERVGSRRRHDHGTKRDENVLTCGSSKSDPAAVTQGVDGESGGGGLIIENKINYKRYSIQLYTPWGSNSHCRADGDGMMVMFSQCFHGSGRKRSKVFTGHFHSAFTVKCKRRDVFTYYPPLGDG
jgi:hypothetical protein